MKLRTVGKAIKLFSIFKLISKPVIKNNMNKLALKGVKKYVQMGGHLRKTFLYVVSGLVGINVAISGLMVYFISIFPEVNKPFSTFTFWAMILLLTATIAAVGILCSQMFWVKALRIGELMNYFMDDDVNHS